MNLLGVLRHAEEEEGGRRGAVRGASEETQMKEGAASGLLIISAHLIRITGRDRGARPGTPTAAARRKNRRVLPNRCGEWRVARKSRLKRMYITWTRAAPAASHTHTCSLLTGGGFAPSSRKVPSRKEEGEETQRRKAVQLFI